MKNERNRPFVYLTVAVFIGLIVPVLIQDGMFMDGVLYTCVARNLANGIGTFWFPEFSAMGFAGSTSFHEHPPLVFWVQSNFFRVFGNSIYVERLYSFVTGCISAFLIVKLWGLMTQDRTELKRMYWFPVLMWIIIPVSFMAFRNNMMENTMGIFTLAAVWSALKGLYSRKHVLLFMLLSGVFIFLATFSKGVPGLFPIAVVGIFWLTERSIPIRSALLYSFVLLLTPIFIYAIILLYSSANESLSFYFYERLLGRIDSAPTVDIRFFTIGKVLEEMIPAFILSIILIAIYKAKSIKWNNGNKDLRKVWLMTLLGCSASAPLMMTYVQKGWYITPALPFFAMGLALWVAPGLRVLIGSINTSGTAFRIFKFISIFSIVVSVGISAFFYGKIGREPDLHHDIYTIGTIIPTNSIVGIDAAMWNDWYLQCYLMRYLNISVDATNKKHEYFLLERSMESAVPKGYDKMVLATRRLDLYRLSEK